MSDQARNSSNRRQAPKRSKFVWVAGLIGTLGLMIVPIVLFLPKETPAADTPDEFLQVRKPHTNHTSLMTGPYETGFQVTERCLECHKEAAGQVMGTVHWTWQGEPSLLPGREEPVAVGKKNLLNNFCIGIQSNWEGCTSCHAGYGWEDADFDFSNETAVDCLVCHDTTGAYVKGDAGLPIEGVDLAYVAQNVSYPTRESCGECHFAGGGGDAVKHGDLDAHLIHPPADLDVHMGGQDFPCVDCHQTEDHSIRGRSISVSLELSNQAACTDCHVEAPHQEERLDGHTSAVACQTCHIPEAAIKHPTKMFWDWSTAGQDLPEDERSYLKIKGSFVYESDFIPEYRWYSGIADRYLLGDTIDPSQVTELNPLAGDISDSEARIFPFKVHNANQPFDANYNYLLQPRTVGEGGFWTKFDWDQALELGSQAVDLPYSGEYGFAPTTMYWPITHLVAPADQALQCVSCHGDEGRLDWQTLGYPGDPLEWGGRVVDGDGQ
jgi:octaheme c-type cytochrome (tetrathionate reductase family)